MSDLFRFFRLKYTKQKFCGLYQILSDKRMNKFLKKLIGRLLVFFGGLVTFLGIAGLVGGGTAPILIMLLILGVGLLIVTAGIVIRLI